MATKKSKSSAKSAKTKTTKQKTAVKSTAKAEQEVSKKTEQEVSAKAVRATKVTTHESKEPKSWLSGFFAKKYEGTESILTIFKDHKFYGSILGEVLGTMLLTLLFFSILLLGIASIANYAFVLIAILIAIYAFSGACLNPLITAGMMATRRMSVVRGITYIIAQVVGAWLGWLIFSAFHGAGGETAYELPAMSAVEEGKFLITALIELFGAIVIGFFFTRALKYKRSVFTFGAVVTGGIILAILTGYVISAAFLGLDKNFVYNPSIAMMLQIFPQSSNSFGEALGSICQALAIYAIFPMIGGVVGSYLADFTSRLSSEE